VWVPGHRGGESEEVLGRWLKARGNRDEIILATKVGKQPPGGSPGLSREQIRAGLEGSLQRLGTDRIDLFYAHEDDQGTPLEETLGAFAELVEEGKVRALGASNFTAPRLRECLEVSERHGWPRYEVVQPAYNLLERSDFEGALEDLCVEAGLGVVPYGALARGFLTGKYRPGGETPDTPRAGSVQRYVRDEGAELLDALDEVAAAHGATPAQVAIAWVLARPTVAAPIASGRDADQVRGLLGAASLALGGDELARLDDAALGLAAAAAA
jgi:aryl-alcohol dehydrogenase-like predicted oxidoreductase